jgi:hypothetical protein
MSSNPSEFLAHSLPHTKIILTVTIMSTFIIIAMLINHSKETRSKGQNMTYMSSGA